jgi:molybdopterin/thiamine biosynthesis adenylyltransferase
MDKTSLINKIKEFGLNTKEEYMAEAFSRNIGLLTQAEQDKLANAKVAIPGMGGVGGVHLTTMTRTGVGNFHIADFDVFEPANINRQFGARIPDFGRPKLEVMVEQALSINPYLEIKEFPEGINSLNVDDFLDGVQVVIDGLDFFNFDTRRLLFNRAREKGIYVITAGPLGFSSAMLIFSPHEGMSFDEYFNIVDGMTPQDQYLSFALGLAPRATHIKYMDLSKVDLESKAGPSLNIACQICSGMAATEAVRIILKKGRIKPAPHFFQFDPFSQKYRKGKLYMGNRNPIQRVKFKVVKMLLRRHKRGYRPSMPEIPDVQATPEKIPDEIIRYIIKAGIQAPSGDNAQPWKFSFKDSTIFLYLNRDADHSFFNINQIASIISCGAVLENMQIATTRFGIKAKIVYLPDAKDENLMAKVLFDVANVPKDPLFDVIWRRHTNRKPYDRKPISEKVLQEFKDMVKIVPGANLQVIADRTELKKVARIIYKTDRIRTEHRPLHEHLYRMLRFTEGEARETRDGFLLKNLEAGLAGEVFLRATKSWHVMNIVNRVGLGRMAALHSYQSILNSSAVALLTVEGMGIEDFLKGGQALERIWLAITQQGLAMQPMTAITLFWLRWQIEGEESFAKKHRKLLHNVWEEYQSLFQEVSFFKKGQVMLFRFGYGEEIKYGTYRKDLKDFFK